jgi:hypothetical protein
METTETVETVETRTKRPNKAEIEKALVKIIDGGDQAFKDWIDRTTKQGATFYNYSFYNTLLIALQCPGFSYISGMKTWNKYGRRVKKGERAIRIMAPAGEDTKGKLKFIGVNVFDYSQTHGDPLDIDLLSGHYSIKEGISGNAGAMLKLLYEYCEQVLKVKVVESDDAGPARASGSYSRDTQEVISLYACKDRSAPSKLSTLLHEMGHALMGHTPEQDKTVQEAQAQAFSYSLARYFAIDNLEYTKLYVQGYMHGKKPAEVYVVVKTIVDMAVKTIRSLSDFKEGLPTERPAIAAGKAAPDGD